MFRSIFTTRFTNKTATFAFAREAKGELLALKEMIENGIIGSIVDRVFPMEQATDAHRLVETEQRLGAVSTRYSAQPVSARVRMASMLPYRRASPLSPSPAT